MLLPVALSEQREEKSSRGIWEEKLISSERKIFFYKSLLRTIEALRRSNYTEFDAHTTSNCCHGMAILVQNLIAQAIKLDLPKIQTESESELYKLENSPELFDEGYFDNIPSQLIDLTSLYLLAYVREIYSGKGVRTFSIKLSDIHALPVRFCKKIIAAFQKHFSNLVANSYSEYLQLLDPDMRISGVPLSVWGKYIGADFLRTDKKKVQYAPCIFSMQVSLAHLMHTGVKVVLVNDLISKVTGQKMRYVQIFEKGELGQMRVLTQEEISCFEPSESSEPVIVFGGYSYSDELNFKALILRMDFWLTRFSHLVIACDTHYPQFPKVSDDPNFNSSPIRPEEECLRNLFDQYSKIRGVTSKDSSLYCLSHIYSASLGQVLQVLNHQNEKALPEWFSGEHLCEDALKCSV